MRTIKMRKGKSAYDLYQECKALFPCWCWNEENIKSITSDRTTKKAYTIQFKDTVEADEDLKKLSANDLTEKGIQGITIEERLQMEIDYFKETGKHLDISNITLCAGSRYSDGDVPFVYWLGGRLRVDWYGPDFRDDRLRSRACIKNADSVKLNYEKDKNKEGFNIVCKRCGLSVHI